MGSAVLTVAKMPREMKVKGCHMAIMGGLGKGSVWCVGTEAPLEEPEGGGTAGGHDTFKEAVQEGQERDGAEVWGGPGADLGGGA